MWINTVDSARNKPQINSIQPHIRGASTSLGPPDEKLIKLIHLKLNPFYSKLPSPKSSAKITWNAKIVNCILCVFRPLVKQIQIKKTWDKESQQAMIDSRSPSSDIMLNSRLFSTFWGSLVAVAVQSLSHVWLFETSRTAAHQASLSFTISWNLLKFMSVESVMPSNHLIFCQALLLPSNFPSIKVFVSVLEYWSFSFSISPSNEYSGLISFRMDWLDLLAEGTLKSLLQHHSLKHQFFGTQPSLWSNPHFHTWPLEKP